MEKLLGIEKETRCFTSHRANEKCQNQHVNYLLHVVKLVIEIKHLRKKV